MRPARYDMEIWQGGFDTLVFEVLNDDGTPMDLTGFSFNIQFRDCPECDLIHSQAGVISDTNKVSFEFTEATTGKFETDTRYEIEMVTPDNKHIPFIYGNVIVKNRIYK